MALLCGVLGGLALSMIAAGVAFGASVSITGPEETVYDKSAMACEFGDIPDIPTRAFRDASGQIQLTIAGATNRRMIGPDFDHLTHPCGIVRSSNLNGNPWEFDDRGWLSGQYTPDGNTVYALIHGEFHGQRHPSLCPSDVFIRCRYNGVTLSVSTDQGASYTNPPFPDNVVATIPYRYVPESGRNGVFSPSNIVERNGYFYAMLLISEPVERQRQGACLMRTKTPSDAASWRAWDGAAFTTRFVNPYLEPSADPNVHACKPVSPAEIGVLNRSFIYNTALNKYFVIGTDWGYLASENRTARGFWYSFSDDAINWSPKQLLYETGNDWQCGDPPTRSYPSIIDHDASGRNFDTTDTTAYLYFNRGNPIPETCTLNRDNDIARVPIVFSP
jgi:hypothetical protein